jgi:hypothetical protein
MRYPPLEHSPENRVHAVFATSTSSFDMPPVATFEDLADRLSRLGEHHAGPLSSIRIEAGPVRGRPSIRTAMLRRLADAGEEAWRAGF